MGLQETNSYDIIQNLRDDFEEKFNNGSRTNLKDIKIGTWIWDWMELKPSISINPVSVELDEELFNDRDIMIMNINLGIYLDYSYNADRDWQEIFKLQKQIKSFLRSTDCTYYDSLVFELAENRIYIGSPSDPAAYGELLFGIKFIDLNN